MNLKGCNFVNTSRARRGRRALARPASRCDTAEAGEGGGALAMSGCRDGRGFGRVKCRSKGSCWWSAGLQQLPLKTNGRNKRDREKEGGTGESCGRRAGSSLVGSSLFFFFFLSPSFNLLGERVRERESLAVAHGCSRPPPSLLRPA